MKVCPVCNESFAKELNFCDVDGARLTRQRDDASEGGEQSKVWPLLGVGLLLGALVISAASIFLSKNRVTPPLSVSGSSPAESVNSRTRAPETATTEPSTPAAEDAVPGTDEIALAETKRRERALAAASQSTGTPGANPKAAALSVEESEKAAVKEEPVPVPVQPVDTDLAPTAKSVKAMSETREPPAAKSAPAITETKETKKPATDSKASGKDSNNKKTNNEKEKKGGFLRVFKKIFGKD
jgi:hypothetical protein